MSFAERHAEWLAQFTPEQRAEKAARYEAFKAEAAALELRLETIRAARGAVVSKIETAALALNLIIPSPERVGLAENQLAWSHLYYDRAINDYNSWAEIRRK